MRAKRLLTPFVALFAVFILTLSFAIGQVAGQEPGPGAPEDDIIVYLPLSVKAPGTILGHVRDGGVVASNVILELRRLNLDTYADSLVDTKTTDPSGYFAFTNQPSLVAQEVYYVKYSNPGNPARLWRWYTRALSTYTFGSIVNIGDFDIADVQLDQPMSGASVTLPRTFYWIVRPATPWDSYEFDLYEGCDNCALFYTDPPLGYVGSYSLTALPPGFHNGTQYWWEIWVYNPDGSYGISFNTNAVTFTHSGIRAAPVKDLPEAEREHLMNERLLRSVQARP